MKLIGLNRREYVWMDEENEEVQIMAMNCDSRKEAVKKIKETIDRIKRANIKFD